MGGFPALQINQPESPLKELGGALAIKSALQEQQINEIKLQEARADQTSQQVLMKKFAENNGDMNKTYADAAASGQVTPQMLNQFRAQSISAQVQMATLTKENLENLGKTHDLAANALESVKKVPIDQRQVAIQRELASLAQQGVDISKIVPALQGLPDYSDASLNRVETTFKGEQWLYANEKAAREAAQAPTTAEVEAKRVADLAKTIADTNKAAADTSLALEHQRQLGQVTPLETYKQQQENYRASLSRQATFANQLQKNGLEQLDKMYTDPQHGYTQFLSQATAIKTAVMQSRNGSELASSIEPLMVASGVLSYAGIHRINQVDVNAAGTAVGSAYRKLNSILDRVGSGSVPEDTQREVVALMDALVDAKHSAMINGSNMVVANAGLDPKKVMVMDRNGVIATLDKAAETNTRHVETPTEAAPATRKVGDSVTIKGKLMKITKLYPDGSFDAE